MEQPLSPLPSETLRFSDLANRDVTEIALTPSSADCSTVAAELEVSTLKKVSLRGSIRPEGKRDWVLNADLGATVVQPCVATLAPVTTRIDEKIMRRYLAHMPEPEGIEVEMPEDDSVEPLPAAVDLYEIMIEALALALPAFPRVHDAEALDVSVSEPGVNPMTDADAKPFAGLGALKAALENKGEEET